MRYLEDFAPGQSMTHGPYAVTREEIIDFAQRFDPQPFHLDDEAGRAIPHFGGLVASGWHTAAMAHRLLCELLLRAASVGSPGVDELRWLRPVRPGDQLTLRIEVLEVTPSTSRPERGAVRLKSELRNQREEVVMTSRSTGMFLRREGAAARAAK